MTKKNKKRIRVRGVFLLGAILLTLSITGGLFAYGFLTDQAIMGLAKEDDFAKVEVATLSTWQVFGSFAGEVVPGDLFVVTPHADWTGDMTCQVTLANIPGLRGAYRLLVLEVQVWDDNDVQLGATEYLTLQKGAVDIEFSQSDSPYRVVLTGGSYVSNREGWADGMEDPTLVCQILQR